MPQSRSTTPHSSFKLVRNEHIDSLNIKISQYQHKNTGAAHYHIDGDNSENVFLVALRTVPEDSTGVAHILEHTALCGSEKFPVRDPFFMMIRRSLNTFMNAFTSSDWTAYPFASQNRKDFNNLLDVYLDAVFFSRLDPLDFAQEGHRVEFSTPGDSNSDLVYKGVVFNEMKGAMSSVSSTLWQTLCKYLYPTSTYHHNSGGDPTTIPDLSYEQLQQFYKSHYHPSNAIFMTFGDISAEEHQRTFEEKALSRFQRLDKEIRVPQEKRYFAPIRVQESYAFEDEESSDEKTHIVLAWLLGESTNLEQLLEAQLLASVLMDNSASPLQRALETTDLGQAPSPLCGLEDSMRELAFVCGIEGSRPEHQQAFEDLVLGTLKDVADNGVPAEQVDSVLHQLELHQREIGGDGYPYGLQLILTALGCATHYSDPIAVLNLDPVLEKLRSKIADPEYIKGLAQKLLLDNPHRVTLVMTPDDQLAMRRDKAEAARLDNIKSEMTSEQLQDVITLAEALEKRQQQKDDESILPKVGLEDVPKDIADLSAGRSNIGKLKFDNYAQGTNGLIYQQIITPMPELNSEQLSLTPYYTSALTEVGLGDKDYLDIQARQAAICGSINAFTSMRGQVDDEQNVSTYMVLSSKALARNYKQQSQLMRDTFENPRFDETSRLKELVAQQRARREQSVTGNGHGLAMTAASAGLSPAAKVSHQLSGLRGIQEVKILDKRLQDTQNLNSFAEQLADIHLNVLKNSHQILQVAEGERLEEMLMAANPLWQGFSDGDSVSRLTLSPIRECTKQIWVTNTQVNFCAQAFPTVSVNHPDSAALTVLGGFLRNGYLHRAIREQGGAYGGGASQDSGIAAFRFFSYRDPRIEETINDFSQSVAWIIDNKHDQDELEQAVLGVIGALDKPSSPAGEAKQHFHNKLFGRTTKQRREFRQHVLEVGISDLQRVAASYLQPEKASTVVITNPASAEQIDDFRLQAGLDLIEL